MHMFVILCYDAVLCYYCICSMHVHYLASLFSILVACKNVYYGIVSDDDDAMGHFITLRIFAHCV